MPCSFVTLGNGHVMALRHSPRLSEYKIIKAFKHYMNATPSFFTTALFVNQPCTCASILGSTYKMVLGSISDLVSHVYWKNLNNNKTMFLKFLCFLLQQSRCIYLWAFICNLVGVRYDICTTMQTVVGSSPTQFAYRCLKALNMHRARLLKFKIYNIKKI